MKRKDSPVSKHSYLCSEHFSKDCFMRCVGRKRYLKSGSVPTKFSFSPEEKRSGKLLFMSLATRETTKSRVKLDKMILNSRSNPVDNLAELESVNIIFHVKNMDFRVSLLIKLRQLKAKKNFCGAA